MQRYVTEQVFRFNHRQDGRTNFLMKAACGAVLSDVSRRILTYAELSGRAGFRPPPNYRKLHGGDWGAHITSLLGFSRASTCAGVHSTALALRELGAEQLTGKTPAGADDEENRFAAEEYAVLQSEGTYSLLHATKPAKLGYAMLDSPVGTVAWIVEAYHA